MLVSGVKHVPNPTASHSKYNATTAWASSRQHRHDILYIADVIKFCAEYTLQYINFV